jgi:hypothetical protein
VVDLLPTHATPWRPLERVLEGLAS